MDENKNFGSFIKLMVQNNQSYDYSGVQNFYREKEWEYEKRSISSLLIGGGSGISLTLAYLSANELSKNGLLATLFTIVCFLICIILAGISQFVLNEAASQSFRYYITLSNMQNLEKSLEEHKKLSLLNKFASALVPQVEFDVEASSDSKFELVDQRNILKRQSIGFRDKAKYLEALSSKLLLTACGAFLFAVLTVIVFVLQDNL